jgi:signal transduction histidine kinase
MKRSRTLRAYVVHLVIAVTLPLLAFGAFLLIRSAHNEQQTIATAARERAQGAAADVDRELRHLQDLISIIASSSDLFADDFAASHISVNPLFKGEDLGLVVRNPAGQFILNTCLIDNQTPSVREAFGVAPSALNDGRSFISDLIEEPVSGVSLLTIDLLVRREGGASYILSLCALPRILQLLTQQHLPEGWTAMVLDRRGRTIASITESAFGSVAVAGGDPATNMPETAKSSISNLWGNLASAYRASSPVDLAGWTVAINVPGEIFFGPFRRSLLILLVAGGGTLALVLVLAINVGRRIAGPIAKLTELARTLGEGGKVDPPVTGVNEADLVARALCSTSRDLSRRTQELTETIAALRNSERRLRQTSADLQRALDQRTELLNRIVSAQESERQRIARELHDHFEQYFVAMLLGLNAAEKAWSRGDKGPQRIAELKEITLSVSREVHQLSWELRPTALDDFGLEAAMANYLEKWRERFSLNVDFVGNLRGRRLPPPIEITLYRVLQEAMTNVAKHANAAKISVALEADPAEVRLIVEDDGTGFDKETAAAPGGPTNGFGLLGIRERLAAVGGSLIIETAPKRGTALFCQIPA